MWSIELADNSGHSGLDRARPILSVMRAEVTAGQFLDVSAQYGVAPASNYSDELAIARRILEDKSARYSIRRPAQIGAALGGADDALQGALGEFGSVIGRAFQLRDDVLGVFGDPAVTGKPYGGRHPRGEADRPAAHRARRGPAAQSAELAKILAPPSRATPTSSAPPGSSSPPVPGLTSIPSSRKHTAYALSVLADARMTDDGRTALAHLAEASVRRAH